MGLSGMADRPRLVFQIGALEDLLFKAKVQAEVLVTNPDPDLQAVSKALIHLVPSALVLLERAGRKQLAKEGKGVAFGGYDG